MGCKILIHHINYCLSISESSSIGELEDTPVTVRKMDSSMSAIEKADSLLDVCL